MWSLLGSNQPPIDYESIALTEWAKGPIWCQGGIRTHNEQPYDSIEPTSVWDYWSLGLGTVPHYTPDKQRLFNFLLPAPRNCI